MQRWGSSRLYNKRKPHASVVQSKKKKPLSRWFEMEKKIAVSHRSVSNSREVWSLLTEPLHSVHTTLTSPREVSRPTTFVSIRGRRRKGAPPPTTRPSQTTIEPTRSQRHLSPTAVPRGADGCLCAVLRVPYGGRGPRSFRDSGSRRIGCVCAVNSKVLGEGRTGETFLLLTRLER